MKTMMTTKRCKTCRWWGDYGGTPADWGVCELAGGGPGPDYPTSLAWAQDAELYAAFLNTHETFGCVQHKPLMEEEPR